MKLMYLTLEGYTDRTQDGKVASYTRTIAYCLPFPAFPISLYTLYSHDDDAYYFSLSTQAGDVQITQLCDLYNSFYRYVFTINRAIISYYPPKLKLRKGMYDMTQLPMSMVCTLTGVDLNLFSYRSNSITFLRNSTYAINTELQLIALRAITHQPIDARLSRQAYHNGWMSTHGYWYVAA